MIGYTVEIKGLTELRKRLANYLQIAERHFRLAMVKSTIAVESAIKPLVPVGVSGMLRNSIASEVTGRGLSIVGKVGSTLKGEEYPIVMEFGRKPGVMPPPSALERWVHLKLGVPTDEALEVAYVVARAIGKRGIKGWFFMKNGFKAARSKVKIYFEQALNGIVRELGGKGR